MSNLLSITDVGIEIPKKSIELLQSVEETCYPEEYERILTTLIVEESQRLIGREALIEKPDIQIGKLCLINYINCTDTATVQSLLCEQAGIDSYIAFSGNHASTIVFFNDHYWHLQGESTVEIKNSEKRSADVDDDKVATVKGALSEIKHNDGVYIYYAETHGWSKKFFTGPDIRKSSPIYDQTEDLITYCAVVTKPELGFQMLGAIDYLDTLRNHRANDDVQISYDEAMTSYKHLLPKLK